MPSGVHFIFVFLVCEVTTGSQVQLRTSQSPTFQSHLLYQAKTPSVSGQCNVTDITSSSAVVMWCNNSDPAATYDVTLAKTDSNIARNVRVQGCVNQFSQLLSGQNYIISLRKDGKYTSECSFTTSKLRLSQPRNLNVVENKPTRMVLTWDTPTETSGPIDGYLLTFVPAETSGGIEFRNISSTEKRYIIKKLSPWTYYNISVCAFQLEENGVKAKGTMASILVKTSASAPSAPRNLNVQKTSSESVQVAWDPPSTLNGKLEGYLLQLNDQSPAELPGGSRTTHQFTGLEPETDYTLVLEAYNQGPIELYVSESVSIAFQTGKSSSSKPPEPRILILMIAAALWLILRNRFF